jgi:hypothetical protein
MNQWWFRLLTVVYAAVFILFAFYAFLGGVVMIFMTIEEWRPVSLPISVAISFAAIIIFLLVVIIPYYLIQLVFFKVLMDFVVFGGRQKVKS